MEIAMIQRERAFASEAAVAAERQIAVKPLLMIETAKARLALFSR